VLAATIALATLAAIAPMFAQQIELARQARDTDLVETAATQDINAIRRFARYWRIKNGPYSETYLNETVTGHNPTGPDGGYRQRSSGTVGYVPVTRQECLTKDSFLVNFLADLKNFSAANIDVVNYPQFLGVARDITPPGLKSRYLLTRNMKRISTDPGLPTMVVTYALSPIGKARPIAFERTAELQLELQGGC
jgi:hypothetical protein